MSHQTKNPYSRFSLERPPVQSTVNKQLFDTLGLQLEACREAADYAIRMTYLLYSESYYLGEHGAWVDLKMRPGEDEEGFRNQVHARLRMERNTLNSLKGIISTYTDDFWISDMQMPSASFILGVSKLGSNARLFEYNQTIKGVLVILPNTITEGMIRAMLEDLPAMKEAGSNVFLLQDGIGVFSTNTASSRGLIDPSRQPQNPNSNQNPVLNAPDPSQDYLLYPQQVDASGVIVGSELNKSISIFGVGFDSNDLYPLFVPAPAPDPTPQDPPPGDGTSSGGETNNPPPPAPTPNVSVLYVATNGSDSNDGSLNAPFATFTKACDTAQPGTKIYIKGGTYNQRLVTTKAGTSAAEIIWYAYNDEAVIIDGTSQSWTPASNENQGMVQFDHGYHALVGNITVQNSKNSGIVINADKITLNATKVKDCQMWGVNVHTDKQIAAPGLGTMVKNISYISIEVSGCNIANTAGVGGVAMCADGFIMFNVTLHDQTNGNGACLRFGTRHGDIQSCNIYNLTNGVGIYVYSGQYIRIWKNKVRSCKNGLGVSSEDARYETKRVWVYNNIVWSNTEAAILVWDNGIGAENDFPGIQNCLIFNNTMDQNKYNLSHLGQNNAFEYFNNIGYASISAITGTGGGNSTLTQSNNAVLTSGERSSHWSNPDSRDYTLHSTSSKAINQGKTIPTLTDDLNNVFTILTDFAEEPRIVGANPDCGAYEYQFV